MLGNEFLISLGQNMSGLGFHFLLCENAHVGITSELGGAAGRQAVFLNQEQAQEPSW